MFCVLSPFTDASHDIRCTVSRLCGPVLVVLIVALCFDMHLLCAFFSVFICLHSVYSIPPLTYISLQDLPRAALTPWRRKRATAHHYVPYCTCTPQFTVTVQHDEVLTPVGIHRTQISCMMCAVTYILASASFTHEALSVVSYVTLNVGSGS